MKVCGRQGMGCIPGLHILQVSVLATDCTRKVPVRWPPTYLLYSVEQKAWVRTLQGRYQLLPRIESWRHTHCLIPPFPCVLSITLQSLLVLAGVRDGKPSPLLSTFSQ